MLIAIWTEHVEVASDYRPGIVSVDVVDGILSLLSKGSVNYSFDFHAFLK